MISYSNKFLRHLGDRVKSCSLEKKNINEQDLKDLQRFRIQHKDIAAKTFIRLEKLSVEVRKGGHVSFRIKRFESIVNKLCRFNSLKLHQMIDIAGCRCILKNQSEVKQLLEKIKVEFNTEIKKIKNYYENCPESGYKSIHIHLQVENYSLEVQIRTVRDHNWATLVEITDQLYSTSIKQNTYQGELKRFHQLMSKENLSSREKKEILQICRNTSYIETVTETFSKNYLAIRGRWVTHIANNKNKYFLIKVDSKNNPEITSFFQYKNAENSYFKYYNDFPDSNIVLFYLDNPDYQSVSLAYSNYMLSYHSFIDEIGEILEDQILQSVRENNIWKFNKNISMYFMLLGNYWLDIARESSILGEADTIKKILKGKVKFNNKRLNNWKKEFAKKMNYRQKSLAHFNDKINFEISKVWFVGFLFRKSKRKIIKKMTYALSSPKGIKRIGLNPNLKDIDVIEN